MAWSYDFNDLGTDTASSRLNSVRLLLGDTDTTDQQIQDEEIAFSLTQTSNNVYEAASWCAGVVASKYSRKVTSQLDGALQAEYSNLAKQYRELSTQLSKASKRFADNALGISAGGISITTIDAAREDDDRPNSAFYSDRFRIPPVTYTQQSYIEE